MSERLKHLLSPIKLRNTLVRNRTVFGAHQTNFAEHNLPSERHLHYYAERAKGGVGLIIIEEQIVHPSDYPYQRAIFGFDERVVPWYRRIADAVHGHGAHLLAQLNHNGQQSSSNLSQGSVWAPSPFPDVISREVPKEMEPEDIREVVVGFAHVARHVRQGGLDGVEINISERSLIRQFLSGLTNYRSDEYGGSLDNRMRLCYEVIDAVREAIGQDLILGIRLCGDELAPWAGLTPEQGCEIAARLATTGKIDYISVTAGSIYSLYMAWPSMHVPPDYALPLAAGVKEVVDVPVFATGRIDDPLQAEEVLEKGWADMLELTRALIADPEFPNKAREGRLDEIRPCIFCNQDCVVRSPMNPLLSCLHNPEAGYEGEMGELRKAGSKKRVMVIGGGPAGLEAARVAALRGHEVALYEKEMELGGQVAIAARGPGREELGKITRYLASQVEKLGVEIKLGVEVTPELVEKCRPDAVVVATGSRSRRPAIPGARQENVVQARDVLRGKAEVGRRVLVIDEAGSYAAASAAELMADQGREVEIMSEDMFISRELAPTLDLGLWYQRAFAKGIAFSPQTVVREISGNAVVVADLFSQEERRIEGVDTVVLAFYSEPNQELYLALKERGLEVHRAGDCVAPRRVSQAILEGNRVGRIL
ncbi:MAG: mycofactocin system FadH/OYE family oxidoreductase 2 [Dehalococcoidia bacterium]